MQWNDAEALERDIRAREEALDPTRSFIVQAPAGSGKTELLIQRYLTLLAGVDAPEEIIAITFTRKAAAEMRVRVLDAMDLAGLAEAEGEHRRRTQHLARAVLRRDAERAWSLREQPGRLRILTIDALNGWLARQMPWLSRLGPGAAVTDNADALYRDTVRAVLLGQSGGTDARQAVSRLLVHLDNRFATVEQLLCEMLAIRDQWTSLVESGVDGFTARGILESTLQHIIRARLTRLRQHFGDALLEESVALGSHAASVLASDPKRDPGALSALTASAEPPGTEPEDLPAWLGICQLLLTDAGEFRKPGGITVRIGFAAGDPMKERLVALVEALQGAGTLRELLAGVRSLPAARFDETQWDIVGSIVTVLAACALELRAVFTRRGVADHIEVAHAARQALGAELEPTDLAMLLEYRIRHILVDEFQDTSTAQFELLLRLTAGWSAPDRHTLFLVGDPMQSIYRFREAEVGLFLQVWATGRIGDVPLKALRLARNFRSQRGVVEWVNDMFARIMPREDDPGVGAVSFTPSVAAREDEEQATDIQIVYSGNRTHEAEGIATWLRDALDGTSGPVGSAAVLVRSRSHLAELVPALRAAGLRFRAVEIESLGENAAVRDLLALTSALRAPGDRIAWLAVLRSPVCGLTLADLHTLCADDADTPMPELLRDAERLERLSPDGRRRLARVLPALEHAAGKYGTARVRSVVEGCWIALGFPSLLDAADLDASRAYLDLLDAHEQGGDVDDPSLLEEDASRLFAPPDPAGDPRLQVMTVHKAKGLEFDVVVLPRLDGTPRRESDRLLLWDRSIGADGMGFLMAPLRARGSETDATYAYIRSLRTQKADHEDLRLLYVAATRARKRLLLGGTLREKEGKEGPRLSPPRARSFLAALWPLIGEEIEARYQAWAAHREEMEGGSIQRTIGIPLRRVPADWLTPALPPDADVPPAEHVRLARPADSFDTKPGQAGRLARVTGVVVHALLARLACEGPDIWTRASSGGREALLRQLFVEAGIPFTGAEDMRTATDAVDRMLADERGSWILQPHQEAENECALTGFDGAGFVSVRIDRTFVDADGVRWIIDYKTASHEGADTQRFIDGQVDWYAPQLRRYARILREWDTRPLRAALYFPLMQEWREIALEANEGEMS